MKQLQFLIVYLILPNILLGSDSSSSFNEYVVQAQKLNTENKKEEALIYYRKALELNPENANALHAAANIYRDLDLYEQATACYMQAIELDPKNISLIFDAANTFNMIDELETAIKLYKKILVLSPMAIEALYNYGYTLKKNGSVHEAIKIYRRILSIKPDYAHPHFSLALAYLSLGNFEQGWKEYEWRWKAYNEEPKKFAQPSWQGQDLQGKTIFLYAEQGLGDSFQFIRYAKIMKERGASVIFESQKPLKKILSLCPYLDKVIAIGETIPPFDYHLPLMSCPLLFNTTASTIPHQIPYLQADRQLTAQWKKKLASDDTNKTHFKIGICWQGNANYSTQFLRKAVAAKSMHISHFIPLTHIPGVTIYSLQKINGTDQIKELNTISIKTFDSDFDQSHGRFMDTAAVIKNLDLVITIDTSIAHFSAALGTPTWILLPNPPDWRWIGSNPAYKNSTPWYPNVRLFTQKKGGDWHAVIHEVVDALKGIVP